MRARPSYSETPLDSHCCPASYFDNNPNWYYTNPVRRRPRNDRGFSSQAAGSHAGDSRLPSPAHPSQSVCPRKIVDTDIAILPSATPLGLLGPWTIAADGRRSWDWAISAAARPPHAGSPGKGPSSPSPTWPTKTPWPIRCHCWPTCRSPHSISAAIARKIFATPISSWSIRRCGPTSPWLAVARQSGARLCTELELFIENCPARIIGVTGTNGKSTTAAMIASILAEPPAADDFLGRQHRRQPAGPTAARSAATIGSCWKSAASSCGTSRRPHGCRTWPS